VRILLLSFYFRPDLSAGSFRATALADSLRRQAPTGSHLDVIATLPNRYRSFTAEAPQHEAESGFTVTRIELPRHQSGVLDQSKAFITFARAALKAANGEYDIVVATSSRLMTAVLGAWLARRAHARLYLDIRDIFVDTIKDVAARPVALLTKPVFATLERWAVRRAARVNLVSRGFADYFTTRYPAQQFSYFTNGIDDEFLPSRVGDLVPVIPTPRTAGDRQLTVLYAGNLGEGQGLHAVLPALARRMGERVRFVVVGDGGRRRALEQALAAADVDNVQVLPPVARRELIAMYRAADVLFLHLNDYDAFKKVLPSKIFEYAALGKPVWAGVSGYAAQFLREEVENAGVFHPCDVDGAVSAFEGLRIADAPRTEFLARFARANISRDMAAEILAVGQARR
jgi:glycosyltransferase involved in cell wall biosynthesis